jgi:hypothetical protein
VEAVNIADGQNGIVFDGPLVLATLSGVGASFNVEEM